MRPASWLWSDPSALSFEEQSSRSARSAAASVAGGFAPYGCSNAPQTGQGRFCTSFSRRRMVESATADSANSNDDRPVDSLDPRRGIRRKWSEPCQSTAFRVEGAIFGLGLMPLTRQAVALIDQPLR